MSDRPDLPAELWQAQQAMRGNPAFLRRLHELGFNNVVRRCCGHPGIARVQWHEHRGEALTFEPCDDGANETAIILPVLGAGIEDLLAWSPKSGRIASRMGTTFAMGEAWLSGDCESVKVFSDPGTLWRACEPPPLATCPNPVIDRDLSNQAWPFSPLDSFWWHPPGIVIIDWNDTRHRLGHVKRIVADNLALAERIEAATKPQPTQRPQIYIDMPEALAA